MFFLSIRHGMAIYESDATVVNSRNAALCSEMREAIWWVQLYVGGENK
jgi:hypothetical protein